MSVLSASIGSLLATFWDVLPILAVIAFFQLFVLRRPIPNLSRVIWGFALVILGLSLFLMGLELALFPLGTAMAEQLVASPFAALVAEGELVDPQAIAVADSEVTEPIAAPAWYLYYWTYLFAFTIGMSTTIAEPALIAVAMKAEEVSGGTIQSFGLRIAVALGVGFAVALGSLRIILGVPLPYFILVGYLIVIVQTYFAPKEIVPLAYDSGGVTTSTVTVPLVAALGLGLATQIPGRDPLIDGFGIIALASLVPIMTVIGYAQLASWRNRRLREAADTTLATAGKGN